MQFSKLILSTLLLALSSMAVAAPAPEADDAETLAKRLAEFEESTVDLAARSGWTCAFGGDKACQVKVRDCLRPVSVER